MSPVGGVAAGPVAEVVLAEKLLQDGEIVILSVKPSIWYVLLGSLPGLVAIGLVAGVLAVAGGPQEQSVLFPAFGVAAVIQLLYASLSWLGRLYVLTNRRILRLRGVLRADVFECSLLRITGLDVTQSLPEKTLRLGTINFEIEGNPYANPGWVNLQHPQEIADEIRKAIHNARNARQ